MYYYYQGMKNRVQQFSLLQDAQAGTPLDLRKTRNPEQDQAGSADPRQLSVSYLCFSLCLCCLLPSSLCNTIIAISLCQGASQAGRLSWAPVPLQRLLLCHEETSSLRLASLEALGMRGGQLRLAYSSGSGETCSDLGYALKVALSVFSSGLEIGCRWVLSRDWGIRLSSQNSGGFILGKVTKRMSFHQSQSRQ